MIRVASVVLGLCVGAVSIAHATDDVLTTRKKLMDANGAATGAAAAMAKEEVAFNPAIAKAALVTWDAVAFAYGDYFPEGSNTGDTRASPKIWEDQAGWNAALEKFRTDAAAALAADPKDLESFKTAMGPVTENCRSCHEAFRLERN
jgi:cytochrome c556